MAGNNDGFWAVNAADVDPVLTGFEKAGFSIEIMLIV